jgi:hypothetical protein
MLRRTAGFTATALVFLVLAAVPAFGWGNGPSDGNGYGTHDWALHHAITMAGQDASWVDVDIALLATDDPDYGATATDGRFHAYKNGTAGLYQGGPAAAAEEYYKLVTDFNKGDYAEASRHLGIMSHYYTDICEPYHTDIRGSISVNSRHLPFEIRVSELTGTYGSRAGWLQSLGRRNVTDVRERAVSAALYARSKYSGLDSSYKSGHLAPGTYAYNSTGYVLNRAVNDLADIIRAVPQGEGVARPPAVMKHRMQKMTYYYPRKGTNTSDMVRTEVTCYDAAGNPMRAVPVTFTWPLASGPKTYVAYTNLHGMAYSWQAPGYGIPLMKKRTVAAKTTQSSGVATSTTWYMPTPRLAYSTPGMKTGVSSARPKRYTTVRAWTRIRDTAGKPVVGLPVTYYWCFRSRTVKAIAITNSKGYAYSSQSIGGSAKGRTVYVKTKAYSGRQTRNSYTRFVPQ